MGQSTWGIFFITLSTTMMKIVFIALCLFALAFADDTKSNCTTVATIPASCTGTQNTVIQTNGSLLKILLQVQTHVILLLLMMDLIPPKMFMFLQPEMVMMVFQLATLQLPQLVSPTPLLLDVFL